MSERSFGNARPQANRKTGVNVSAPETGSSSIIAGVLAVAVCAVAVIAYRSGTLHKIPVIGPRLPIAVVAPRIGPDGTVIGGQPAIPAPPAEPGYFKRLREPEMQQAIRRVQTEPLSTNALLRAALATSFPTKKRAFTPEQFAYIRSFGEAANKAKDGDQANDIFGACLQTGITKVKARPGDDLDPLAVFAFVNDSILCLSTTKPQQLCEPVSRRRFVGQLEYYSGMRRRIVALTDINQHLLAEAALEVGVHQNIRQELRKLATKNVITLKDFGASPPTFIVETIGDIKEPLTDCGV